MTPDLTTDLGTMPLQGRGAPPGPKRSRLKLTLKLIDRKQTRPTKSQIFELSSTKLNCFLTGLTETDNGFIAYTDLNSTIDSLTSNKGQTELRKLNLETVTPPEIRAKRTVFIRGLDYTVGQRDTGAIANELTTRQPWLTKHHCIKNQGLHPRYKTYLLRHRPDRTTTTRRTNSLPHSHSTYQHRTRKVYIPSHLLQMLQI